MRGWPVATIAFYGPNLSRATKVAVGSISSEDAEPAKMRDWSVETGDVRAEMAVAGEILEFIETEGAISIILTDSIMGCPHQQGIDYEGEWCPSPRCRFTGATALRGSSFNRAGSGLLQFRDLPLQRGDVPAQLSPMPGVCPGDCRCSSTRASSCRFFASVFWASVSSGLRGPSICASARH